MHDGKNKEACRIKTAVKIWVLENDCKSFNEELGIMNFHWSIDIKSSVNCLMLLIDLFSQTVENIFFLCVDNILAVLGVRFSFLQ